MTLLPCFILSLLLFPTLMHATTVHRLTSPDQRLVAEFTLSPEGVPSYNIQLEGRPALRNSRLGLIRDDADFSRGLIERGKSETETMLDRYEILTAKRRQNEYRANRTIWHLETKAGRKMDVIFQVSNDGAAFRYEFPESSEEPRTIREEVTSFHFPKGTKAWLQPIQVAKTGFESTNPAYEEYYEKETPVGTPSMLGAG